MYMYMYDNHMYTDICTHVSMHICIASSIRYNMQNACITQVLDEDLRLVVGQQDRMVRGANVWNLPVAYDKLGVRYRKWRLAVEHRDSEPLDLE